MSGVPAQPAPGQPGAPTLAGQPGSPAFPGQPGSPAFPGQPGDPTAGGTAPSGHPPVTDPAAIPAPPAGYPPYGAPAPPKKKRGLLIAAIALVVVLVLCVGGGVTAFLTLRNVETGEGAKEPAVAVERFLTAVYRERDAAKATALVCSSSRDDDKIATKVAEVEKYVSEYKSPRFRWTTPKVDNQTGDRATVSTKVTMTTADEKVADQELRFTVVQKTGWWVCEVA
ncbi:collagen-like protein [Micromonospora sp. NPDC093243]|uniref:collagen-like triple helix repeat-containing protein n=1 Tax=Micromonospora sp. NPDC093243 TaxID=3364290 RepID=UPI00380C945B